MKRQKLYSLGCAGSNWREKKKCLITEIGHFWNKAFTNEELKHFKSRADFNNFV